MLSILKKQNSGDRQDMCLFFFFVKKIHLDWFLHAYTRLVLVSIQQNDELLMNFFIQFYFVKILILHLFGVILYIESCWRCNTLLVSFVKRKKKFWRKFVYKITRNWKDFVIAVASHAEQGTQLRMKTAEPHVSFFRGIMLFFRLHILKQFLMFLMKQPNY